MEWSNIRLDLSKIDKRISHLTEKEIKQMISKYYDGISVKDLKEKYNVTVHNSQFITILPKMITNINCLYCGENMVKDWKAKYGYSDKGDYSYCPQCKHKDIDYCRCRNCEELRRDIESRKEKRKRAQLNQVYHPDHYKRIAENDLDLEEKLYLSVIARGGLTENLNTINPVESFDRKLTPTQDFTAELVKSLTSKEIIIPHPNSPLTAFSEGEKFPYQFYIYKVYYWINIEPYDGNYENMIERLMYPKTEEYKREDEFCIEIWRKIALHESIEYLLYSLKKIGFPFKPGDKTVKVFQHLLEHFSVSQVYNIIYKSVANAAKIYQEKKITKQHAANSVITYCESYGERAIAEGWTLSRYRRDYNLTESLISSVFFTTILKNPNLGFDGIPDELLN